MGNRLVIWLLFLFSWKLATINSQTISNYVYKFDNGAYFFTEKGWNWINARSTYIVPDSTRTIPPLLITIKCIGDLFTQTTFKVLKDSSVINPDTIQPGIYKLAIECRLLQNNGAISFDVNEVVIKEKMQTIITVLVYDTELIIDENPASNDGLIIYEFYVIKNTGQNGIETTPHFYSPGTVSPEITPVEALNHYMGKNKPGVYDIKITNEIVMTGFSHKVWLKNISLKPDTRYVFSINLNVAEIRYSGDYDNIEAIHLYPAGTANKLKGIAKPQKNIEVLGIKRPGWFTICPPGSYDILLEFGQGAKFEWCKGIVAKAGEKTDVE